MTAVLALCACGQSSILSQTGSPVHNDFQSAKTPGTLYVANQSDNSISVFTSAGQFLRKATNNIAEPVSLGLDESGNVYIANYGPYVVSTPGHRPVEP
jgi:DNA-binding beta-propeller fold protein YncE